MSDSPKIPIRNIYWMLCYAWNTLSPSKETVVGSDTFSNIYDLLSRVLVTGIHQLLKRGFAKSYCSQSDDLSHLRGKILLNLSIKQQTMLKRRMICSYDDFTPDISFNQILKYTLSRLARCTDLSEENRRELKKVRPYFSTFSELPPSRKNLSRIRYNQNNKHYRQLISICSLIYNAQIANEQGGKFSFSDFIRDKQMAKLYEKFVLQFYRKHLSADVFHVFSPKITWAISGHESQNDLDYLPDMRTDIVLDNRKDGSRLIIDTKFYPDALTIRNYSDTKKLISANLYQMYAYLGNDDRKGAMGILLYPTVDQELNLNYHISEHPLIIRTLNLNQEWADIEKRLMSFLDLFLHDVQVHMID